MRALLLAFGLVLGVTTAAWADPSATFKLERGAQPHAGMPFNLLLIASGLDESPAPDQPKLAIAGATVTPLGGQPNVSRSIQIVNGRRSESNEVTWVFTYRVEVASSGRVSIPATRVAQGGKSATAEGAQLSLDAVPISDDMKLELQLPNRPVFVGEAVEAQLVWLFRAQPQRWTFAMPLAQAPELVVTAPPAADPQHTIEVASTAKTLHLPYTNDEVEIGGQRWGRVTIAMYVAPRVAGKVSVPATSVSADLATGPRDFFGDAQTKLYKALDVARTLEVKPLPETDKPAGFAGAVGTSFSIGVGTSRSVVQVGEPLELTVTVKSSERLDALALPRLDGPGMLPADKFSAPAETPTGELSDDGKTKTFKVTAQITAPTNEIPALTLAYFDPVKGTYQSAHSDPVALSVAGSSVVTANDVVSAAPHKQTPAASAVSVATDAELALSAEGAAASAPLGGAVLWLLVALGYLAPIAAYVVRTWQLRTRAARDDAAEVRAARKALQAELARAETAPARETAGPLAQAIRAFARVQGTEPDRALLARLETESFAPSASSAPLPADLRAGVQELARTSARAPKRPATATALVIIAVAIAAPTAARADAGAPLADGRKAYEQAMTITDVTQRKAAFQRAETLLGAASDASPGRPELLADWGNAALAAGDVGTATLAYRRALAIDPRNARALRNLSLIRERAPELLRPLTHAGAAETLLFFSDWPRSQQLLLGAACFAIAVLLLVPWTGRRRRGLALLAILPAIVWLATLYAAITEDHHASDAIVLDATTLRAADSAGAPAALVQPLPPGTEVAVVERRGAWAKVRIASGTAGWVEGGAIIAIAP